MNPESMFTQAPFTVLDGGLSTALEAAGHDLRDELWTARLLVDSPDAVTAAHRSFVEAGAQVVISASYQASVAGLVRSGCSPQQAREAIVGSTELARAAGAEIVAASIGPYGAVLGDGSEYSGDYVDDIAELARFHQDRLALIVEGGPDVLAIETMPSAREVEVVLDALRAFPEMRAWVSVTCGDDRTTWAGDSVETIAQIVSESPQVIAVGVNCVAPPLVTPLLRRIATITALPLVAYPNHGRRWDGVHHHWVGDTESHDLESFLRSWVDLGARLIGGCCGYGPEMVGAISMARTTM